MTKIVSLAGLLCLLSSTVPSPSGAQHSVPASRNSAATANVAPIMARWRKAWSPSSDTSAMWTMLADSVMLYGIGQPKVGPEAVRGWVRSQAAADTALRVRTIYEDVSGDQGYSSGRWTMYSRTGQSATGVYTFVLRRGADGRWRIQQMLIVVDPRPAARSSR